MYRCRMTLRVLITLIAVLALCTSLALAKEGKKTEISVHKVQFQNGPNWDLKQQMNQDQGATGGTFYEGEASKIAPHRLDGQPQRGRSYSSVYLSEDFEGTVPPGGWGSVVNDAGFTWQIGTLDPYSGLQYADILYDSTLATQDEWLVTPSMDFSAATTDLRLDFYWFASYYWAVSPYDNYNLEVWVSTDGGATFTDKIWDENSEGVFSNYTYYNKVLDLSTYAGQSSVAIGFRYNGSDGAEAAIDLVTVTDDPPPVGRCCFASGTSCSDLSEADCFGSGGESWDEGLTCAGDPCPVAQQGDNCSDPLLISLPSELPYLDKDQYTCGRTNDYDATCLGLYDGGEDIVYKISVASEVTVDITLDPQGTTYTGFAIDDATCPLDAATCVAQATNSGSTPYSITSLTLSPGDYFLMVDTWPSPDCIPAFDLTINEAAPPTPGDNCAAPFALTLGSGDLPYTESGLYNCGRGDNYNATCLGSYDGGEDFVMELTLTEDLMLDITLDPKGTTWSGFALDDVCPLDAGSGDCIGVVTSSSGDPKTMYGVSLTAGTYYIMVDTYPTPTCIPDFDLTFAIAAPPPDNDDCANATPTGDVISLPFSTAAASFDGSGDCQTAPNVWYDYTAPIDGAASFSLCGSSYDTKIAVYDGCGGTLLACNDDFCSLQSQATVPITMGSHYWVEVGGYSSTVGDGVLTITSFVPPPNDNCEDVTPVTLTAGVPVTFTGDNTNATNECSSLLASDGETWHAFELTECSDVTIDYCGTSPAFGNAWIVVITGCPCDNLVYYTDFNTTDCGDGNVTINFASLPAGVYYYPVLKDPAYGAVGPYTIHVVSTPVTDYCAADGGGYEYISQVDFQTISNASDEDGYADYTNLSTPIVKGQSIPLTVTNGSAYSTDVCNVWVDWNQDQCFSADEQVGSSSGYGPYSFAVSPPMDAASGKTRMRIRICDGSFDPNTPCGSTSYGEVEDYSVEVRNDEPTCTINPNPQYLYFLFAVVPITNEFQFGMFDDGYTAADVDMSSVTINGHPLASMTVMSGVPGFIGDIVYGTMTANTFITDYGSAFIGTTDETFDLEGSMTDATPFSMTGHFKLAGKMPGPIERYIEPYIPGEVILPGDFDLTGTISIGDAVALINYIFGGGTSPENVMIGDVDCSGGVSIGDAVRLINYIFGGGAAPCAAQ